MLCKLRFVCFVFFPLQVVIDAFRLINANMMVLGHEPRQTTSNLGHLNKPSIQACNTCTMHYVCFQFAIQQSDQSLVFTSLARFYPPLDRRTDVVDMFVKLAPYAA